MEHRPHGTPQRRTNSSSVVPGASVGERTSGDNTHYECETANRQDQRRHVDDVGSEKDHASDQSHPQEDGGKAGRSQLLALLANTSFSPSVDPFGHTGPSSPPRATCGGTLLYVHPPRMPAVPRARSAPGRSRARGLIAILLQLTRAKSRCMAGFGSRASRAYATR